MSSEPTPHGIVLGIRHLLYPNAIDLGKASPPKTEEFPIDGIKYDISRLVIIEDHRWPPGLGSRRGLWLARRGLSLAGNDIQESHVPLIIVVVGRWVLLLSLALDIRDILGKCETLCHLVCCVLLEKQKIFSFD
jgi:hypothetical protein